MRKIIVIALVFISIISKAQTDTTNKRVTFKSNISRISTFNEQTKKWETQDFFVSHLIVFDLNQRKVFTYMEEKDNELDILSAGQKDEKGKSVDYTWKCVDIKNVECTATIAYLDNKPLFVRIQYQTVGFWYFIDENQ